MQADWQALQPMHFDTSISLATGASWRSGGGTLEADLLTRSALVSLGGPGSTETLGSGGNIVRLPSDRRRRDGLDVDQERLEFRRLDIGVSDEGGQRVRAEALLCLTHESPMERDADDMHRLAVAGQRRDALGHDSLGVNRVAVRPHPHPAAWSDAFLLGELFRNLDEEFRLQHGIDPDVLGPEVEVLGQAVRGRR